MFLKITKHHHRHRTILCQKCSYRASDVVTANAAKREKIAALTLKIGAALYSARWHVDASADMKNISPLMLCQRCYAIGTGASYCINVKNPLQLQSQFID